MSKESGVHTYRGEGGIWEKYNWKEYACQTAFIKDPLKVLNFHELRRKEVFKLQPHDGYTIITKLQNQLNNINIITQNIDGFHKKSFSKNILELHGDLWSLRCKNEKLIVIDNLNWSYEKKICKCGGYLRPNIIWFEDPLNEEVFSKAITLVEKCQLFISIGTSGLVYPAASLPKIAKKSGAYCIEINPEETELSYIFDEKIRLLASEGIRKLFK